MSRTAFSFSYLAYLATVAIKGVDGAIETALGILIAAEGPSKFYLSVVNFTRPELDQHPAAQAAARVAQHGAAALTQGSAAFAIFYLLVHGVLKLGIAMTLLFGGRFVFPIAVLVFGGFVLFLGYHALLHWSGGIFALMMFDLFTVLLIVKEWRWPHTGR